MNKSVTTNENQKTADGKRSTRVGPTSNKTQPRTIDDPKAPRKKIDFRDMITQKDLNPRTLKAKKRAAKKSSPRSRKEKKS